jgi:hypothetical protein
VPHLNKGQLQRLVTWLKDQMPAFIRALPHFDVLLIERTDRERYYRDAAFVIDKDKASGKALRCIANHEELVAALSGQCAESLRPCDAGFEAASFANLSLERCSLFYQCHLFAHAKVVIAQHGAALSNIAFMVDAEDLDDRNGARLHYLSVHCI